MAAADATADAAAHIADAADANDAAVDTDADDADADTADADADANADAGVDADANEDADTADANDRCPPAASKSLRDFDAAQGIDRWEKECLTKSRRTEEEEGASRACPTRPGLAPVG
jgi:hypothetical protein